MAAIKSRFRISRFQNSCCIVHFPSPCRDSRNSDMELDQRSRYDLDSMAAIESRFRILRFRHSCCIVFLSLHVAIRETPIWSWINGPDLILIQWLRLNRDFAYRDFDILVALFSCLSMSRFAKLRYGVGSTVQI
jgi:hypothetical protein